MLASILAIILIDLVLAGDNAVVIAMAARRLPADLQLKAMIAGTGVAVVLRIVATLCILILLKIPGLMLIGGGLLMWIAYGLLVPEGADQHASKRSETIWQAVKVIAAADFIMSLDNMLGVAGAAKGDPLLVVLGLVISIPIMIFGSAIILSLLNKFPWLVYVGAGILAWTAASMILHEPLVLDRWAQPVRYAVYAAVLSVVLIGGYTRNLPIFSKEQ